MCRVINILLMLTFSLKEIGNSYLNLLFEIPTLEEICDSDSWNGLSWNSDYLSEYVFISNIKFTNVNEQHIVLTLSNI